MMDAPVVFAAVYASAIALAALGIDWAGRAGLRRRPGGAETGAGADNTPWPHTASLALHTVVATVAAVAGLLVAVVMGIRHHRGGDLLLLAAPAMLAVLALRRLHGRLRAAVTHQATAVTGSLAHDQTVPRWREEG